MDNQDKTTFSLDDDEIVEEEVIERDEEYDDGEDYDDEEYDDEEYDDEEDYDDEEEYYDDDGYNDDYYDDRLNKVLDEIAELKRGMVPAVQQQQPVMPPMPQYIYQPTAPSAGSEVVMYNEISRLRDELAKNTSSLEMQKELTKLKDDMARDQKIAETQYKSEIQRLQSKIDDLLKNGSGPQSEFDEEHLEGTNSTLDLEKLLSINEAVLRATRDSDARIQNEIGQLKKQLDEIPSLKELNGAVSAVKKAASSVDGIGADSLGKLSGDIAALRAVIEEKGIPVSNTVSTVAPSSDISASELLRQLYEIKTVLGNSSEAAVKRAQVLSDLVNDYKKVKFDVNSQSISYKDKLASVYGYAKKLVESNEQDGIDLINSLNELIAELAAQPLTRSTFADIAAYGAENGAFTVTSSMRDSAEKFFSLKDKLENVSVAAYGDYLTDITSAINGLQNNRKVGENAGVLNGLISALREEKRDDNAIKANVMQFVSLGVGDAVALPKIELPKAFVPMHSVSDENIFTKLTELKSAVLDNASASASNQSYAENAGYEQAATLDDGKLQELLAAVEELKAKLEITTDAHDVTGAFAEIRDNYLDISGKLVDISEKIQQPVAVEVEGGAPVMTDEERIQTLDDLAYIRAKLEEHEEFINQIGELREDIANIGNNIDLTEPLAEQVNGLLAEINTQFDKLYEDISNILIESEANIIGRLGDGAESPIDAIDAARTDILADTQAIKDTLLTVTDSIFALPLADSLETARAEILADTQAIKDILGSGTAESGSDVAEAIEQLRADIAALIDMTAANAEVATGDRQKILDDVAFLREQAELALGEGEALVGGEELDGEVSNAVQDPDKLSAYLDDIAAHVAVLTSVAEDTASTKETVGVINDNIAAVSDNILTVAENMNTLNENISAVGDGITALGDIVHPMAEDVASAREAATAALEALAPITEQLNSILERLDVAPAETEYTDVEEQSENVGEVSSLMSDEELAELKDSLNTILDTLPLFPQADDVVTTRDNTYAIIDTLALMPQADDVAVTRDNVAALLDIVTSLSDNLEASLNNQSLQQLSDGYAALTASAESTAEDVKYIREKLDEMPQAGEPSDEIANIMQDIGLVLDKIEAYEQMSADNKQEIIDAVSGIREEIHINTLDENMSAAGIDDETRDALVGEIADIRERLGNIESSTQAVNEMNTATLDGISAQLAEVQAILEERLAANAEQYEDMESGEVQTDISGDNMQALIDELAAIRERLDNGSEYDTVEEILSLREDIKAARIVDQDEVTGELEAIKNELAAISSGNILDEIRALREDIINLPSGDGASAPTDGEINLVLNEIVSLRDEVFAMKDEMLNAAVAGEPLTEEQEQTDTSDDIGIILDELTALRADQGALTENIDELKDIISRRTTLGASEDGEDGTAASAGGLNVVLDEIINLKNDIDRIEESVGGDRLDTISAQVDELRAIIEELHSVEEVEQSDIEQSAEAQALEVDLTPIMEQFDMVNAALDDLRLNKEAAELTEDGAVQGSIAEQFDELHAELDDIRASIEEISVPQDYATELAEMRAEIEALRAENEQLKQAGTDTLGAEIAELKDTIRDMMLSVTPATSDGDTSYAALIEEIRGLRDQVSMSQQPAQTAGEPQLLGDELAEIRDEIAQLRSLTTITAESGGSAEISALRDELAELKELLVSSDSMVGVAEDLTSIKADVQTLKEEPDLGVMSEILALRDEFQALREQIEDVKRIAGENDREASDTLMNEVQSLRDQLFAISMANVSDSASGESNYESYNNIILDELASLRDQVNTAGSAVDFSAVTDEVAELKSSLEKREELFDALSERIKHLSNDATNNKILDELASLRTDMENQRDADLTTLNFMSEMAHLLERQNQYLTQNAGTKISDEIESLKAEIASSDAVAEEVAKLREVMTQSGNASDNETILNELADLREELSREKPSQENALILDAIARLRDEVTLIAEREKVRDMNSDADLSDSLSDLKEQLNEIAGIMEPASEKKQQAEKSATATATKKSGTGAKRGRKPGSKNGSSSKAASNKSASTTKKSGTGAKRGRKPASSKAEQPIATPVAVATETEHVDFDFEAKIDEQMSKLSGGSEMSLNLKATTTADAMDVADKLAKQVANKLIMEQLVEQLGDGGVSEDRVDEILRDILPQEFTTIAETEASDKVRRLANRLVLDKLRARLNGNRGVNDDDDE